MELENPVRLFESRVPGKSRGKGHFIPDAGSSSGSIGSMARTDPTVTTVVTNTDLLDDAAVVEFGVDELFIALHIPTEGRTDTDILMALESSLDANGVPATFDAASSLLSLDIPIADGQRLVWGSIDSGLDFLVSFEGLPPIPEPGSVRLSSIGLVATRLAGRRRFATIQRKVTWLPSQTNKTKSQEV